LPSFVGFIASKVAVLSKLKLLFKDFFPFIASDFIQ